MSLLPDLLVIAVFPHSGDRNLTLLWPGWALLLVDRTQKAGLCLSGARGQCTNVINLVYGYTCVHVYVC